MKFVKCEMISCEIKTKIHRFIGTNKLKIKLLTQ